MSEGGERVKGRIPILGAIREGTGEYIIPRLGNKRDRYVCPGCGRRVIFRRGEERVAHFAHKREENECSYYTRPTESQIHKDGKMLMRGLIERGEEIEIRRECKVCKREIIYKMPEITIRTEIEEEYEFKYKGRKIADIAYIEGGEMVCIIEIYNTHRTEEGDRPEPWFEIEAINIIMIANETERGKLRIPCIREDKCSVCNFLQERHKKGVNPIENIYLEVAYKDREWIKGKRGHWDSSIKKWYIKRENKNREEIIRRYKRVGIRELTIGCDKCEDGVIHIDGDYYLCGACQCNECRRGYDICECKKERRGISDNGFNYYTEIDIEEVERMKKEKKEI